MTSREIILMRGLMKRIYDNPEYAKEIGLSVSIKDGELENVVCGRKEEEVKSFNDARGV